MAEEETTNAEETDENPSTSDRKFVLLVAAVLVVTVFGGAGFLLGRVLASPQKATAEQTPTTEEAEDQQTGEEGDCGYVEFESLSVSLSGPRMDRYIRVAIILATVSYTHLTLPTN